MIQRDGSIQIELEHFEGPLDLLLYLIRKEKVNIYDIPLHKITSQYIDYIKCMKPFNLEDIGDFIAMAATLIHMKSKMLLPKYSEDFEEEEDPRKDLVQKLLEYEQFQKISKDIDKNPLVGRDVWLRGQNETFYTKEDRNIVLEEGSLFQLIGIYRHIVKNLKSSIHKVFKKTQSIASRILEMRSVLRPGQRKMFSELITPSKGAQKLITFLSLLELTKMGFIKIFQNRSYEEIYIDPQKVIQKDIIHQVEEYDNEENSVDFEFSNLDFFEIDKRKDNK